MKFFTKMREKREQKQRFEAAHKEAVAVARGVWDGIKNEQAVITMGEGAYGSFVSAAGPDRIAWEEYFDVMRGYDLDPWQGYDRLDKEMKNW